MPETKVTYIKTGQVVIPRPTRMRNHIMLTRDPGGESPANSSDMDI